MQLFTVHPEYNTVYLLGIGPHPLKNRRNGNKRKGLKVYKQGFSGDEFVKKPKTYKGIVDIKRWGRNEFLLCVFPFEYYTAFTLGTK